VEKPYCVARSRVVIAQRIGGFRRSRGSITKPSGPESGNEAWPRMSTATSKISLDDAAHQLCLVVCWLQLIVDRTHAHSLARAGVGLRLHEIGASGLRTDAEGRSKTARMSQLSEEKN